MPQFVTREAWLQRATDRIMPIFRSAGVEVPDTYVSVGWPGGKGSKKNVVGQCWASSTVRDGRPAIFISPVLEDPRDVLVTLTHELVHATGLHGHRGGFARLAGQVGLVAPWTATPAGPDLNRRLTRIASRLGDYPHARVSSIGAGPIPQGTRMLKVTCPEDGYLVRTTRTWLDIGLPLCPAGHEMQEDAS